ncbi:MAG: hypothetical protein OZ934_02790 [Anaerolineae bacterium]|nr:hypothetical protein [Anaerolineae bacterium]
MTARLMRLVKWLWLVLVAGAVVRYLWTHWGEIGPQLRTISPVRLALAAACLFASKLLLILMAQRSVNLAGHRIGYRRMFPMFTLSQLAKYLPGGIWHFVGRAGFYHADGLPLRAVTRAMVIENLWLVLSASLTGLIGTLAYYLPGARAGIAVAGLIAVWWALLWLIRLRFGGERSWRAALGGLMLQAAIWALVGISLWIILPAVSGWRSGALALGAFCLSWVIGYVAVFAPGGIGVRETVMTALLVPLLAAPDALVYAAVHRFAWVATELVLGILAKTVIATPLPAPPADVADPETALH